MQSDENHELEDHSRRCDLATQLLDACIDSKSKNRSYGEYTINLKWHNGLVTGVFIEDRVVYK